MIASQLMSRGLVTCRPQDSLQEAAQRMWDHDIGCVPVLDAEGHVAGMITDRDVCMAALTQGRRLDEIPVSAAMSRQVFACLPTDRVEEVEIVMNQHQVRRIPIIDPEGHLVGLISINDIARESQRELNSKIREVTVDGLAATLASIGRPREPGLLVQAAE